MCGTSPRSGTDDRDRDQEMKLIRDQDQKVKLSRDQTGTNNMKLGQDQTGTGTKK